MDSELMNVCFFCCTLHDFIFLNSYKKKSHCDCKLEERCSALKMIKKNPSSGQTALIQKEKNVCLNIDKSTKHCAGTVLYLGKGSYLFKSVFSKLECDGGSDGEAPSHRIYTVCKPSSSAK